MIRCQLPVSSPLSARDVARAAGAALLIGEPLDEMRRLLCARFQADRAILCGSGTMALQLALAAAREVTGSWGPIALPGYGCYDLATAAVGVGAPVVLYDVDPETLQPDPESVESALRSGARVLLAAPLYGYPVHWERLEAQAAPHGALVVEDAAQGSGAWWRGARLGALGRVSVLSFGRGKGWTGGRGGALLLRRGAADIVLEPAEPGRTAELSTALGALLAWALGRPATYGVPRSLPWLELGQTVYHPPRPAAAMDRVAAGLAVRTADASEGEAEKRRASASDYTRRLAGSSVLQGVHPLADAVPGYLRYPVRLRGSAARAAAHPAAVHLGIARGYPTSLAGLAPLHPLLQQGRGTLAGAEELARSLVTLPTHSRVTPAEREHVIRFLTSLKLPGGPAPLKPGPAGAANSQPTSCGIS